MSLFRIDKATVSYKSSAQPFLVRHANVGQPKIPIFPITEETPLEEVPVSVEAEAVLEPEVVPKAEEEPVEIVIEEPEPEKAPDIQLPDPVKLVEEARVQAEAIRIQAQSEAQKLIDDAKAQAVLIKQQAQESGYQVGYDKGDSEGKASYDRSIQTANGSIASVVARLDNERLAMLNQLEEDCLKLAIDIANKIIGTLLSYDETAFMTLVRNGIANIMHDGRVTIRVSPDEYEIFFPDGGESISTESLAVHVIEDEALQFGDLRIESDIENVDASVRRQMGEITAALENMGPGK